MNRRYFLKTTLATGPFYLYASSLLATRHRSRAIHITKVALTVEKEPLLKPFGFKGGSLTELWQVIVQLTSSTHHKVVGLGTQSVLWSDEHVFSTYSEQKGNELMYNITAFALGLLENRTFTDPITVLDEIFEDVYHYGKEITNNAALRKTFILNALVAVDNALWLLYSKENQITNFDEMIPSSYRNTLSFQQKTLSKVPLISYNTSLAEVERYVQQGAFFIKIKIGQSGTQQEMLEKDKNRLTQIHKAIGKAKTLHSNNGRLCYYLDANGRYEHKETLQLLLKHAKDIGAFEQIAIIEEPFPETSHIHVGDLGIPIAADESAHTDVDVVERINMGYRAIALKPIAKTLSMTLKILKEAHKHHVPCLCADLTVNPILVEWNKSIAARLPPFPGTNTGLIETNGQQNYKNWALMSRYSPMNNESWTKTDKETFLLTKKYYEKSGGIFENAAHYSTLFETK
ncbi:mandelate racemase/muconate lactonizing enzyme family protein [Olivibacter domesticus]|uniref:L-alanine-DL-glutamate epimerase n=1 Tax=Olivibacter domesticus TaxID=407022 RepID=A0A1H7QIC7_OLID1|nr:mandelate racemase/muconate lactonizing enzyme family protein [Olivibacter domesticus]SEL47335.1 L-alanine-DL-glutamate epimerase [Olivibacter domesticus]